MTDRAEEARALLERLDAATEAVKDRWTSWKLPRDEDDFVLSTYAGVVDRVRAYLASGEPSRADTALIVLGAVASRHDWIPGGGPCICEPHLEARRLKAYKHNAGLPIGKAAHGTGGGEPRREAPSKDFLGDLNAVLIEAEAVCRRVEAGQSGFVDAAQTRHNIARAIHSLCGTRWTVTPDFDAIARNAKPTQAAMRFEIRK